MMQKPQIKEQLFLSTYKKTITALQRKENVQSFPILVTVRFVILICKPSDMTHIPRKVTNPFAQHESSPVFSAAEGNGIVHFSHG